MRRISLGCILDAVGITVIVVSFLFPFHFFLPAWSHKEMSLKVEPYKAVYIDYDLFMGGTVRGTVQVSGGGNNTIDFHIEDSQGEVLTQKKIIEKYTFEFTPQNTGLHKFCFDNTINVQEPKSVHMTIQQYYYNILFLCLGFGVFICGIALIVTASE